MVSFDSHCHLDAPEYDADREDVVRRAVEAGVNRILVPAADPRDWPRVLACARQFPAQVRFGLGVHPWSLPALSPAELAACLASLEARLQDSGAAVVGECGLDGFIRKRGVPMEVQAAVVRAHLELSLKLGLPVVLHCLNAHGPLLELLRGYGRVRGVLHSYSGPAELVPNYAAHGLAFSFAGALARPNARKPLLAAAAVPDPLLLLESDGPDQPLQGPDGPEARSEPAGIRRLAALVQGLRGREIPDNRALILAD